MRNGSITISCDTKASFENVLCYDTRAAATNSSIDLLCVIHDLQKDLPITLIPKHVKGHQDSRSPHSLTLMEKLNCYTDEKAGTYRKQIAMLQNYKYSQLYFSSNWYCKINGTIITSKFDKRIMEHIYYSKMQTFLHHNKGYTTNLFTDIDWDTIENATKMLTLNCRI